jgi:hypothetical protein
LNNKYGNETDFGLDANDSYNDSVESLPVDIYGVVTVAVVDIVVVDNNYVEKPESD